MKWIIVTGDTGSLGCAIVKRILKETEFGVIGIGRRNSDSTDSLANEFPDRYRHLVFDLNNAEGVKTFFQNQIHPIGRIFGFVNNAANAYDDLVTNLQLEPLETMYRINVFTPMLITKYVLRDMLVSGVKGSIVHISSVSAHTGYKGLAMYASSKGALEAFSKGTAREWGEMGIRSNVIAPGFMETAISAKLTDEQRNKIYKRTSLKKATSIDSVAELAVFLMSDKASSITGTTMHVDNGTV